MNRAEAEMLMGSLDSLTHTGLTKRGQDIQDRHAQAQQSYNNRHLDALIQEHKDTNQLGQDRLSEEMAHHANLEASQSSHFAATEAGQTLARELASKKNQADQLHKTISWLSDGVKHGAIKADVANQQLGGIAKTLPPESLATLQASPIGAAILSGQPIFQDVPVKETGANAPTANMKDANNENIEFDAAMQALESGDDDAALSHFRTSNTLGGINEKKMTGNVPFDTKTTTVVPDMNNPFNKVATTEHVRVGSPPPSAPAGGTPATASDKVMVTRPDGRQGLIPRSQLEAAKAKGYTIH